MPGGGAPGPGACRPEGDRAVQAGVAGGAGGVDRAARLGQDRGSQPDQGPGTKVSSRGLEVTDGGTRVLGGTQRAAVPMTASGWPLYDEAALAIEWGE